MCGSDIPKSKRIVSGVMIFMMLFVMLFSTLYIVAESDHDCTGEDCPVCACIHQCENTLHQFMNGVVAQISVVIPVFILFFSALSFAGNLMRETLVSKKVRLNN